MEDGHETTPEHPGTQFVFVVFVSVCLPGVFTAICKL